ncbi:GNAT family N-acetyltransferase [Catenulispora subtropica]|uniref:N-acetyltransferase domain-containing protein n=1 Tax=Catenulispora subtropica TaxID=450798 RepID=A0ABP5CR69_9ACTN
MTTIEAPSNAGSGTSDRDTVRLVEEHDLAALEVLDKEVFQDLAYSKHYLRTFYNLFRKTWFVVDRDGDLAGYALIGPDSDNREAWLLGLAVSERHQGHGLGRKLMRTAVDTMKDLGVADGFITVRPDNEAAFHLYESFGFLQDGEEREDYYGNGERRKVLRHSFEVDARPGGSGDAGA